jgi:hypothetical protein
MAMAQNSCHSSATIKLNDQTDEDHERKGCTYFNAMKWQSLMTFDKATATVQLASKTLFAAKYTAHPIIIATGTSRNVKCMTSSVTPKQAVEVLPAKGFPDIKWVILCIASQCKSMHKSVRGNQSTYCSCVSSVT